MFVAIRMCRIVLGGPEFCSNILKPLCAAVVAYSAFRRWLVGVAPFFQVCLQDGFQYCVQAGFQKRSAELRFLHIYAFGERFWTHFGAILLAFSNTQLNTMDVLGVQKLRAVGLKFCCSNCGVPRVGLYVIFGLVVEAFLAQFWCIFGTKIDNVFVLLFGMVLESIWEHFVCM